MLIGHHWLWVFDCQYDPVIKSAGLSCFRGIFEYPRHHPHYIILYDCLQSWCLSTACAPKWSCTIQHSKRLPFDIAWKKKKTPKKLSINTCGKVRYLDFRTFFLWLAFHIPKQISPLKWMEKLTIRSSPPSKHPNVVFVIRLWRKTDITVVSKYIVKLNEIEFRYIYILLKKVITVD